MKRIRAEAPESRSPDLTAANIAHLASLFPEAFTDGKVDFAVLRALLGDAVDETDEKYGLNWHGKRRARRLALTPSTGTLRPCPEESVAWESTRNLMIEGDNLEVLKLLQKSYTNKVKLIYIDPPYNTGKDFVYRDNHRDGTRNYLRITGQLDGDGDKLCSNTDASGRFHTNWLNMMYPRLKAARTLLRQDGVLIASISDAEAHHLRAVLDEIFGYDNFLGCVMWNSTKSVTNTALISVSHTYNVIYARNREHFVRNRSHFRLFEKGDGFANPDDDPRGPWKADPFQVGGERPNQMYPITNPNTGKVYRPNPGNSWKNELQVFRQLLEDNRIVFGVSGEAGPQRKRFLSEAEDRGKVAKTWWDDVDTTTNATRAARNLMGADVFDNPKPVSLIRRFIQLGTHEPSDTIVLDFFAGSGTTAQAVIEQNEDDKGNRRYVLVQFPEVLDGEKPEQKAAFDYCERMKTRTTLSELTKERLRRAGRRVKDALPAGAVDAGFRVFKLDSSNVREWEVDRSNLAESLLDQLEHVKPDRGEEDLFYELLLKLGHDLCAPVEQREIAGKRVNAVAGGALVTCLAESIKGPEVDDLALGIVSWRDEMDAAEDVTVVFRDSAFEDDVAKANMTEILGQYDVKDVRSL